MFGRNKEKKEKKEKQLHPSEVMRNLAANQIEQLAPGRSLVYKLPEFYWSGFGAFLIIDANPDYPQKGRRYIMSTDKATDDGKPAGRKYHEWDSNKVIDVAAWIANRDGELYSETAIKVE